MEWSMRLIPTNKVSIAAAMPLWRPPTLTHTSTHPPLRPLPDSAQGPFFYTPLHIISSIHIMPLEFLPSLLSHPLVASHLSSTSLGFSLTCATHVRSRGTHCNASCARHECRHTVTSTTIFRREASSTHLGCSARVPGIGPRCATRGPAGWPCPCDGRVAGFRPLRNGGQVLLERAPAHVAERARAVSGQVTNDLRTHNAILRKGVLVSMSCEVRWELLVWTPGLLVP